MSETPQTALCNHIPFTSGARLLPMEILLFKLQAGQGRSEASGETGLEVVSFRYLHNIIRFS